MSLFLSTACRHPVSLILGLALLVLLAACAATPTVPTESMNAARDAITSAQQAGARQHAQADLTEAQRRFELAEQAVEAEDMVEADQLAQQARLSAELASAKTESARAVAINQDMRRAAEALEAEMQRQGDQQ